MSSRKFHLHDGRKGSAFAVRVTPRADEDEVAEILSDGTVRIRLTVTPGERQINQALISYLARILDVPESRIEIVAGENGRDKLVSVLDLDARIAQERLVKQIGS
ncbi:MAG: DUF167 domain-containing protein [Anaerolineales bacterium]|jgi:uncharacterized protein|nr:DUF167 domain-containing protein [Anaerolineales bacterium]